MNAALVKIDVAAVDLHKSIPEILRMVDGGDLVLPGLVFVFNVARDPASRDRELRFWREELLAVDFAARQNPCARVPFDKALRRILPERITNFHAGQVDELFQLRPRTRIDLHGELRAAGANGGRHFYARTDLAAFLQRRWLAKTLATDLPR